MVNNQANIGYYALSEVMRKLTRAEVLTGVKDNEPEGDWDAGKPKKGWKPPHKLALLQKSLLLLGWSLVPASELFA